MTDKIKDSTIHYIIQLICVAAGIFIFYNTIPVGMKIRAIFKIDYAVNYYRYQDSVDKYSDALDYVTSPKLKGEYEDKFNLYYDKRDSCAHEPTRREIQEKAKEFEQKYHLPLK